MAAGMDYLITDYLCALKSGRGRSNRKVGPDDRRWQRNSEFNSKKNSELGGSRFVT